MNLLNSRCGTVRAAVLLVTFLSYGCSKPPESGPINEATPGTTPAKATAVAPKGGASIANAEAIAKTIKDAKEGGVTVINFWATWCPPCVKETPALNTFFSEYKDKGVRFVSISADDPATLADKVAPFIDKYDVLYNVLVMEGVMPDQLNAVVGAEVSGALPETFLFDKAGKLVTSWLGEVTLEGLVMTVDPLLDAPAE